MNRYDVLRLFVCRVLDFPEIDHTYDELIEAGYVELDGNRACMTAAGARILAQMLTHEERARPCACGDSRSAHSDESPHACLACGVCRSFTSARPRVG